MNNKLKRLAIIAMFIALSSILSYLESFIPVFIPGVKLGLANVIILIMLYEFKFYEALIVQILRILAVSLVLGTIATPTFLMSLSGGILAYLVMLTFSRIKIFTVIGTSIMGSISHSVGQIFVAIIIMGTKAVIYYLPFIMVLSLATGILSGIIARTYLKRSITNRFIELDNKVEDI